jgi:ferritin-like metal-binding protein YciE
MPHKELFDAWLKDAYSMEKALVPILENHAKDSKDHPRVRAKIEQHLVATRKHAELIRTCLERRGEKTSALKTAMGGIFGALHSKTTGAFRDELVKNAITDFATENFEIACYKALIKGAEELGDQETARVCREILRDEEDMARFLDQELPNAVTETLQKEAAAHAK